MAFLVPCPKCTTRLRCATCLPAGSRLTCPACQNSFTTRRDAEPAGAPRPRRPDDDIPAAVILDDEPDDDRPPARRPNRDRRQQAPRPEPVRDATTAARKAGRPGMLAGLAAGALVIVVVLGTGIYLIAREISRPATTDLLALVPTDAVILTGYDLEDLGGNPACRRALERRAPPDLVELDRAGLRTTDLSRALVARTVNNGNTCVVRFRSAPDRAKYLQSEVRDRKYAPFTSVSGRYRFGYFADRTTLVLAEREVALEAIQEKGPKERLAPDLKAMVDLVRGPVWRASGRLSAPDHARLAGGDDGLALRVGPTAGTAAWAVPDGPLADFRLELAFDSRSDASTGAGVLRGTFVAVRSVNDLGQLIRPDGLDPADAHDFRRGYEEAEVSESGTRVTARLRLPASEAIRAVGSVRK